MAPTLGSSDDRLIARCCTEAPRLAFAGVVRVLEEACPNAVPIGHQGPPRDEAMRFRLNVSLGFSASDITRIEAVDDDGSGFEGYEITTNFLGIVGTDSPLPAYYTDEILADDDEPGAVTVFLDCFHHRLLSLVARGLTKYRHAASYRWSGDDPISRDLRLLGGDVAARDPQPLSGGSLVRYTCALIRPIRSGSELETVLRTHFEDLSITLTPCVARWIPVPTDQRCGLGHSNSTLGIDVTIGDEVLDRTCTYALRIGPVTRDAFQRLLPGGDLHAELRALLGRLESEGLDCLLTLELEPGAAPDVVLDGRRHIAGNRLGWSTWLGRDPDTPATVTILLESA